MCGIVAYIGRKQCKPILLEGLNAWNTAATTRQAWPS